MINLPSRKILKKMEFLKDQEGIMTRYISEEGSWEDHLKHTKEYITDVVKKIKPETISILGSGWLLDVPIEFLAANCKKIYLYDIHHPAQIRHKLRQHKNVVFVECDLTGGFIYETFNAVELFRKTKKKIPVENLKMNNFIPEPETDYTISVNLLNQLDILLIDYLEKFSIYSDTEIGRIRTNIQQVHINSLKPGQALLITDYQEILYDEDNKQTDKHSLVYTELPAGKNKKYWDWDFDTNMTYYAGKKTKFRVVGIEL